MLLTRRSYWPLRARHAERSGAAAVEMAIVCPILLLLAFAVTDFGRVIYLYLSVSNAARVGAEYGSLNAFSSSTRASWESQIRTVINNEMQGVSGYQPGNLQLTISTTTDSSGLYVVTTDVVYPFSTVISWPGVPSYVLLDHSVTMRRRQ